MKAFMRPVDFRQDIRVKRLMSDLPGGIGYGVAMLTIETLSGQPGMRYPTEAIDLLAYDIGVSLPILTTVLTKYALFDEIKDENGKNYICPSLNVWQEPYAKKVQINSLRGQMSGIKKQLGLELQLKELTQTLSSSDSSKQIINKKNKEIKKTLSLRETKNLKQHLINKYNNTGETWEGVGGYKSLSIRNGYLHNNISGKDLTPSEAVEVWGEITNLYKNQQEQKEGDNQ
ncbi:MAG: hypothetical protein PHE60_05745 [Sulfurospirillaceae bacterium]|nr:hypothetical protein [Sulfurospirillaceae bacterium]